MSTNKIDVETRESIAINALHLLIETIKDERELVKAQIEELQARSSKMKKDIETFEDAEDKIQTQMNRLKGLMNRKVDKPIEKMTMKELLQPETDRCSCGHPRDFHHRHQPLCLVGSCSCTKFTLNNE